MIYLASPYTHPEKEIMEERYQLAMEAVYLIEKYDYIVYSPIVHYHEMSKRFAFFEGKDYEFWRPKNQHMLAIAEAFAILDLNGWQESFGVSEETKFAYMCGHTPTIVSIEKLRHLFYPLFFRRKDLKDAYIPRKEMQLCSKSMKSLSTLKQQEQTSFTRPQSKLQ